ncbi:hypothetical protein C6I20_12055 [Aeromicrobium sp. A1-2]|nr:hypothetical protein C6I20_12055 [Aeromicrobium sp. A1-2]
MPGARVIRADDHTWVVLWGELCDQELDSPIALCRAGQSRQADALHEILPPFAAINWEVVPSRLSITVDWLGLRHVYVTELPEIAGASSSAAALAGADLDTEALGVQSLLGWQIETRTPFAQVRKIPPGARATLCRGRLTMHVEAPARVTPTEDPQDAPRRAAELLSSFVTECLDDHPDTVLQLTGGQDSRILLAAIPRNRRSTVEAMTLAVPGSPDVAIATRLAAEFGMKHRVVELAGLGGLSDHDAYTLCVSAARDLDCAADPVGFATLRWAESSVDQQPRLAGLGGEVARGFYYFGPTARVGVSRHLASALGHWRMFPNERVDAGSLTPEFATMARGCAVDGIHRALAAGSDDWWTATDEFYLWQRMQRWAGTLASATCFDRIVINPMLDHGFLEIARGLPPEAKKNMRFLSRILLELDADLADVPLDNRPTPRAYASPTVANRVRLGATQAHKVVSKARQRMSGTTHPPPGANLLTAKVIGHWRGNPELLDPVHELGIFRPEWLAELLVGKRSADASAVALLVNLTVALDATHAFSAESTSLHS